MHARVEVPRPVQLGSLKSENEGQAIRSQPHRSKAIWMQQYAGPRYSPGACWRRWLGAAQGGAEAVIYVQGVTSGFAEPQDVEEPAETQPTQSRHVICGLWLCFSVSGWRHASAYVSRNPRIGLTSQPAQLRPTAWGRLDAPRALTHGAYYFMCQDLFDCSSWAKANL